MVSLQYLKLKRKSHEPTVEGMGRLQTDVEGCDYKVYDGRLTEHFIFGLDDEGMISEILREVSAVEDINDAKSECILPWSQRV